MKLYFVSLGCDKNLVDSEKMLALLVNHNLTITDDAAEAEVIIVNTCSFICDAKEESIETILEMAEHKKKGRCQSLIVTGCLAQRYTEEIQKEIPEADVIVGTTAYDQIVTAVEQSLSGNRGTYMRDTDYLPAGLTERIPSSPGPVSYLKIAEGCNKRCTYCIIPSIRGNYRSVPMDDLVREARQLASSGTRELILVAQETTVYGMDLYKKKSLPELLVRLCRIEGIEWIRLMYCYPEEITEELLQVMQQEPKICHYLDLPVQHCNDEVLRRMGRKTNKQDLLNKIARIRHWLPDVALRTTLISGFPGETAAQHEECVNFVRDIQFDRLGVFPYSSEEGTPAAEYTDQVDEDTKHRWADEIMQTEQEVIFRQNESMVGKKLHVLVEGFLPEEGVYMGRTYRDAPEIDGSVFFEASREILSGTILTVLVTDAKGYDLTGEVWNEEEEENECT